jgi:PelA/Pel-15E family pectate lyase
MKRILDLGRSILVFAALAMLVISCHSQPAATTASSVVPTDRDVAATNATTMAGTSRGRARTRWGEFYLRQKPEWYASAEARAVADIVLQYQSPEGAWPKNTDLTIAPTPEIFARIVREGDANTIDNGATVPPLHFLALIIEAGGGQNYRAAFARGLDYLFAAQYPNGGWPQFFPLRDHGYYSHITYNDDAMMSVMFFLRDVAAGKAPYDFVDAQSRAKAVVAVAKGVDCILKTQIRQDGRLTAWCAQYDEKTLRPAWARNFEPPSLSGDESVGIVRFLMGEKEPSPEVIAAVEGAVAWFKAVQINGLSYHRGIAADGKRDGSVMPDPDAGPLWARFYELGSNRPIFIGRDQMIHYSFGEIERERRGGYNYYGDWPASLLTKDYPRWRKTHALP